MAKRDSKPPFVRKTEFSLYETVVNSHSPPGGGKPRARRRANRARPIQRTPRPHQTQIERVEMGADPLADEPVGGPAARRRRGQADSPLGNGRTPARLHLKQRCG